MPCFSGVCTFCRRLPPRATQHSFAHNDIHIYEYTDEYVYFVYYIMIRRRELSAQLCLFARKTFANDDASGYFIEFTLLLLFGFRPQLSD